MKKLLLAAVAAIGAITTASAADMAAAPYAKAPALAPLPTWAGFYIGAMGGYAHENTSANGALSGGFAGGTIGYNWQGASPIVFGLEADAAWADVGATVGVPGIITVTDRIRDLGTARGRIGYAFGQVMIYGTGGYAWIDNRFTATVLGVSISDSKFHSGWTAGAGVEVMVATKWSVKAEYLYRSFSSERYFVTQLPPGINSGTLNLNSVQVGVNYHF